MQRSDETVCGVMLLDACDLLGGMAMDRMWSGLMSCSLIGWEVVGFDEVVCVWLNVI